MSPENSKSSFLQRFWKCFAIRLLKTMKRYCQAFVGKCPKTDRKKSKTSQIGRIQKFSVIIFHFRLHIFEMKASKCSRCFIEVRGTLFEVKFAVFKLESYIMIQKGQKSNISNFDLFCSFLYNFPANSLHTILGND